jgi:hypothetical protein
VPVLGQTHGSAPTSIKILFSKYQGHNIRLVSSIFPDDGTFVVRGWW